MKCNTSKSRKYVGKLQSKICGSDGVHAKELQPEDTIDKERLEVQSEEAPVKKSPAPSEESSSFFDEIE